MSDRADNQNTVIPLRRLSDAIRDVKNAAADREDVVVELREATRMRLQLLAAELAPVFAEVPRDIDSFDFALSSGLQPRLWVDAVAHVCMGRDRRTYRFLRDSRNGRVVIAETAKMEAMADHVTRYIAERIVEREQALDGGAEVAVEGALSPKIRELPYASRWARWETWSEVLSGAWVVVAGAGFGFAAAVALLWHRLTAGSN